MINGIWRATSLNLMTLGYILTFLISGLFILIWRKSKADNKTIYLIGLIIYGFDTMIFVFTKEWFSLGFHIFALIMLYGGYVALRTKLKETKDN